MTDPRYESLQRIGGRVSRETFDRLVVFEAEFRRWSARINLAAPSTLGQLWERHVLDSAQILPLAENAKKWVDLGSGGGFPGAILAILLSETPGATVTLVESNRKKAAFLQSVLGSLRAPAIVLPVRIDEAPARIERADVVTARALAALPALLELAAPWLSTGSVGLFHKGRDYRREIENCRDAWQFDLLEHRSAVDADGVILEISGLARKRSTR